MFSTDCADDDVDSLGVLVQGRDRRPTAPRHHVEDASSPGPIFLCHSSEDRARVREVHDRLTSEEHFECWLDKVDLIPGQDWESTIKKALRDSSRVLVFLTRRAIERRSYLQKELRLANDEAQRLPPGRIFLIPVRLEPCELPESLAHLHCVDLFDSGGFERLVAAIRFGPT